MLDLGIWWCGFSANHFGLRHPVRSIGQQLFDMIERLESVARALQQLTLPEDSAPPPPCTAASLAVHVSDAGRAITSLTAGWRQHLPDPNAQQDALRLSNAICRSLVQLAAIERRKETTDETKS